MQTTEDIGSVAAIITSPPFITVDGLVNLRDALASKTSAGFSGQIARPSYIYRSGEPAKVTDQGRAQFMALGIKKVFDLRSQTEIKSYQAPPLEIDGVEVVNCPIMKDEAFDPASLAKRLSSFDTDEVKTFLALYFSFLKAGGPSVELILRHIRDQKDHPCLIHCTAGKDRTGVFVALIQLLAGMGEEDIINDYALTTYGLQPLLPTLLKRFEANEVYKNNWSGALNMATAKAETFRAFLSAFREKYGTVEQYIKAKTSLNDDDIEIIRANLLISASE
ncbi:hypothetical protein PLEOSDRAFT_1095617 [Pleurotus ostreatus PC15]|uniref:Tyrosine specific protein phosphatases domain-containing protein n=1 Tax=Pleurotus ostreatus (strain PC15) TaxID=1137138 RepID=A0A067P1Q6_PLEO1|nr:hypothetical protein PLEOSDRAFT_1095617 [Pleurotus ostreatus PC15]